MVICSRSMVMPAFRWVFLVAGIAAGCSSSSATTKNDGSGSDGGSDGAGGSPASHGGGAGGTNTSNASGTNEPAGRAGSAGNASTAERAGSGGSTERAGNAGRAGTAGIAGTSGNAGSTAGGGDAANGSDPFTLAWEDNFDAFESSLWELQTFTFDGNLAQFSTDNVSTSNGILTIHLTPEPSDTSKPYRGVEMRSVKTITYGKVEAKARFAKGSGVVSSLVLIYTPWPADDWNEIDIEHLGKTSQAVQLNCQVYTGPATTPPVTTSVSPTQDPKVITLGFDAEADFHVYAMEWTPTEVRFTADGTLLRTWANEIARMHLPQNILFTIWPSSASSWAGPITTDSAPTSADIDWIKVYERR